MDSLFFEIVPHLLPLFVSIFFYTKVLTFNENRNDLVEISDIILKNIPTIDTSTIISALSVVHVAILVVNLVGSKERMLLYIYIWHLNIITRCAFILVCPFKVFSDHKIMKDKIIDAFIANNSNAKKPFVNDLMYSGHVSAWISCYFVCDESYFTYITFFTIVLSVAMMLCKAHYTIDILVAPFVIAQHGIFAKKLVDQFF